MNTVRVTLTLDPGLLDEARAVSGGNFSRFVSSLLQERLETLRRQRLLDALRDGYVAEAEADLEIAREYQFIDRESAACEGRFAGPSKPNPHRR